MAWLSKDEQHTLELAAMYSGINVRTLSDVIHDRRETLRFPTADAILTGIGYFMAWRDDPELSEFYGRAA